MDSISTNSGMPDMVYEPPHFTILTDVVTPNSERLPIAYACTHAEYHCGNGNHARA
ncbi:MAG: hypothetical protein IJE95_02630 [Methanocorpusculum sp.]|nr:hypothetical protein [Methanocorpusculum sp.]